TIEQLRHARGREPTLASSQLPADDRGRLDRAETLDLRHRPRVARAPPRVSDGERHGLSRGFWERVAGNPYPGRAQLGWGAPADHEHGRYGHRWIPFRHLANRGRHLIRRGRQGGDEDRDDRVAR